MINDFHDKRIRNKERINKELAHKPTDKRTPKSSSTKFSRKHLQMKLNRPVSIQLSRENLSDKLNNTAPISNTSAHSDDSLIMTSIDSEVIRSKYDDPPSSRVVEI